MSGVIKAAGKPAEVLGQSVRPFGPLAEDHLMAYSEDWKCPACKRGFVKGEITCLLVMGSPENEAAREEAASKGNTAYNAVATPAHWACVTGSDDPVGDFERYFGGVS